MEQERGDNDIRTPQPSERRHDVDAEGTIQPWEESPRTQGFHNGGWNYNHNTRNEAGPALTAADADQATLDQQSEK